MIDYDYYENKYEQLPKRERTHDYLICSGWCCLRCDGSHNKYQNKKSWKKYRNTQYRESRNKEPRVVRNGEHWRYKHNDSSWPYRRTQDALKRKKREEEFRRERLLWFKSLGSSAIGYYIRDYSGRYHIIHNAYDGQISIQGEWYTAQELTEYQVEYHLYSKEVTRYFDEYDQEWYFTTRYY